MHARMRMGAHACMRMRLHTYMRMHAYIRARTCIASRKKGMRHTGPHTEATYVCPRRMHTEKNTVLIRASVHAHALCTHTYAPAHALPSREKKACDIRDHIRKRYTCVRGVCIRKRIRTNTHIGTCACDIRAGTCIASRKKTACDIRDHIRKRDT
jgi:hypothetical protein